MERQPPPIVINVVPPPVVPPPVVPPPTAATVSEPNHPRAIKWVLQVLLLLMVAILVLAGLIILVRGAWLKGLVTLVCAAAIVLAWLFKSYFPLNVV